MMRAIEFNDIELKHYPSFTCWPDGALPLMARGRLQDGRRYFVASARWARTCSSKTLVTISGFACSSTFRHSSAHGLWQKGWACRQQ